MSRTAKHRKHDRYAWARSRRVQEAYGAKYAQRQPDSSDRRALRLRSRKI